MIALVTNYHYESVMYDTLFGEFVRKVSNLPSGKINIFFDEDMVVDPESNFIEQIEKIYDSFRYNILNQRTLSALAAELTMLLKKTQAEGWLFTGDQAEFMSNHPGMLLLYKDPTFEHLQKTYYSQQIEE
jgi:hypothetical protein